MKKLIVELGEDSYPILIGENILSTRLREYLQSKQVMIVTNETIAPLYLEAVKQGMDDRQLETVIIPDGEKYKTLDTFNSIITRLLEARFSRNSTLLALGGGVVGDITGFAAASYQRGVNYIQIPTTLLAQVDSSVGGKTAVNHPLGKNMIGAFYQPKIVIADTSTLHTLPERELRAGLSEVIKYGLIRDRAFFDWLESNIERMLKREKDALMYAIEISCMNKARVVAIDEKESGLRAILNLGHTFGHAIETGLNYQGWLHGEAVATGMLMAADLSQRHGWLSEDDVTRTASILERAGLPVKLPDSLKSAQMLDLMAVDKKARDGKLHLVLLKSIGEAIVTNEFDSSLLTQTLEKFSS